VDLLNSDKIQTWVPEVWL